MTISIITTLLFLTVIAIQFVSIGLKDKQIENLNIETRDKQITIDLLRGENFKTRSYIRETLEELENRKRENMKQKHMIIVRGEKIRNRDKFIESQTNKFNKEIACLEQLLQHEKNKYNLLSLKVGDLKINIEQHKSRYGKDIIKRNIRIKKLETALKEIDRKKFCITFNDLGYPSPYPAMSGQIADMALEVAK